MSAVRFDLGSKSYFFNLKQKVEKQKDKQTEGHET